MSKHRERLAELLMDFAKELSETRAETKTRKLKEFAEAIALEEDDEVIAAGQRGLRKRIATIEEDLAYHKDALAIADAEAEKRAEFPTG